MICRPACSSDGSGFCYRLKNPGETDQVGIAVVMGVGVVYPAVLCTWFASFYYTVDHKRIIAAKIGEKSCSARGMHCSAGPSRWWTGALTTTRIECSEWGTCSPTASCKLRSDTPRPYKTGLGIVSQYCTTYVDPGNAESVEDRTKSHLGRYYYTTRPTTPHHTDAKIVLGSPSPPITMATQRGASLSLRAEPPPITMAKWPSLSLSLSVEHPPTDNDGE